MSVVRARRRADRGGATDYRREIGQALLLDGRSDLERVGPVDGAERRGTADQLGGADELADVDIRRRYPDVEWKGDLGPVEPELRQLQLGLRLHERGFRLRYVRRAVNRVGNVGSGVLTCEGGCGFLRPGPFDPDPGLCLCDPRGGDFQLKLVLRPGRS